MLRSALLAAIFLTAADPLMGERGHARPLVIVAPSPADPSFASLSHALDQSGVRAAFAERQIVVFTVLAGQGAREGQPLASEATRALLSALGIKRDGPCVMVLIGKDGGVKLRSASLTVPLILETIDRMPMRRREMQRR